MSNTIHYKRNYESLIAKVPIIITFTLIILLLFGNFMMFRPYVEEAICTVIDIDEKTNLPSNHYVRTRYGRFYLCHYQYEYNDCTYDFYRQQFLRSEIGEQRLILINPSNPSKYVFSSEVVSWKNVLLPFSTNKYKDGTYTKFAMCLQDKYEYDWELNK